MKFGVIPPYGMAAVEDPVFAGDFCRAAEQAGMESVWVVEHTVMCPDYTSRYPYDRSGRSPFNAHVAQPDPLLWLAWAAAHTETLRLATGVMILPQRNPLILAKELATLDRLSGGRLVAGFGVGWVREEAEALGSDFGTRGRRADECIEVMRELWSEEATASYHGSFYDFDHVVSRPRPVQKGGVPLVIGGHSEAAARRAGRYGDGFFPLGVSMQRLGELRKVLNDAAKVAGRDPARVEITCVGTADPALLSAYAEAGVDRTVVACLVPELDAASNAMQAALSAACEAGLPLNGGLA